MESDFSIGMSTPDSNLELQPVTRRRFLRRAGQCAVALPLLPALLSRRLLACDTMVALPGATLAGGVLFAKNSDRHQDECQPLVMRPRANHAKGAMFQAQFLAIPQVGTSYRHVGSRPHWCTGYEHGFNEHQVAIGNEALPSLAPPAKEPRLVGMEIIRLALERSASAAEAVRVITGLVEQYGQGKFEAAPAEGSYDNIFLCADPRESYIVECVGHDWAVKRVREAPGFATISNIGMLGKDADRVSASARANAVKLGLAKPEAGGAFNWAETFCRRPATSGAVRQRRTSALLGRAAGGLDARAMMRTLADHADGKHPDEPWAEDVRGPVSVCMHRTEQYVVQGGPFRYPGSTAASLVADFSADGRRLPVYWCGMYSPCMTLFQPVFVEGDLPPALAVGGEKPSDDSPWWMFHRLTHDGLRAGPARRAQIRAAWRPLQDELFESAYAMAKRGRELIADGAAARTKTLLTRFMAENTVRMLELGRSILARH